MLTVKTKLLTDYYIAFKEPCVMQTAEWGWRWDADEGCAPGSLCGEDEDTESVISWPTAAPREVLATLPVHSGWENKPRLSVVALQLLCISQILPGCWSRMPGCSGMGRWFAIAVCNGCRSWRRGDGEERGLEAQERGLGRVGGEMWERLSLLK